MARHESDNLVVSYRKTTSNHTAAHEIGRFLMIYTAYKQMQIVFPYHDEVD